MDLAEIKGRLLQDLQGALLHLLPGGVIRNGEFCAGSTAGEPGNSLKVKLSGHKRGIWCDFASGSERGDIVDLWKASRNMSLIEAMDDMRRYLNLPEYEKRLKRCKRPDWPSYNLEAKNGLDYLHSRLISRETVDMFGVVWDEKSVTFPYLREGELIHWKRLEIDRDGLKKSFLASKGSEPCLFGWQALFKESRSIVICEGEIDAMSFHEYGVQALSVPFGGGVKDKQQWADYERERLNPYDLILLAMDDDYEGQEAAREIALTLGPHRCKVVRLPYKDCNECLLHGVDRQTVVNSLMNASSLSPEQLRASSKQHQAVLTNVELEQFVLKWLVLNDSQASAIFNTLDEHDFYWPSHRAIFSACRTVWKNQSDLDVSSVIDQLARDGAYGEIVSRGHIDDLILISSNQSVMDVCKTIRSLTTRRMLADAGKRIQETALREDDSAVAVSSAQRRIIDISNRETSASEFKTFSDAIDPVLSEIQSAMSRPDSTIGCATGFKALDMMSRGLHPGQLIVLAGRPGMGKTAFLLNIINENAINRQKPVVLFSMEMSERELYYRLISVQTGIPSSKIKGGAISREQFDMIVNWKQRVCDSPLYIHDASAMTPSKMAMVCERMMLKSGRIAMVMVDYIQLMRSDDYAVGMNRNDEIASVSRGLKALAKKVGAPVVAASQLSRAVEMRVDKRPVLSDLRESGAIEQDADMALMLYRDEYYNRKTETPGIAEVIIAKHRDGPSGSIELIWDETCLKFRNLNHQTPKPPF